jgi:hypothetical protein
MFDDCLCVYYDKRIEFRVEEFAPLVSQIEIAWMLKDGVLGACRRPIANSHRPSSSSDDVVTNVAASDAR